MSIKTSEAINRSWNKICIHTVIYLDDDFTVHIVLPFLTIISTYPDSNVTEISSSGIFLML